MLFLIHCGSMVFDKDNMQNKIWNDIMNYLSNSGFPEYINRNECFYIIVLQMKLNIRYEL